mgnify:CR=1 FL=1
MADSVAVHSKSNDDDTQACRTSVSLVTIGAMIDLVFSVVREQWVWESSADSTFSVYEDAGEPLGRGTKIVLSLKARSPSTHIQACQNPRAA